MTWSTHKFGGTSLANAERYQRAAELIRTDRSESRRAVIVSAMGGVTDRLLQMIEQATAGDRAWSRELTALKARHHATIDALLPAQAQAEVGDAIEASAGDLEHLLETCRLLHGAPTQTRDLVAGHGELWSARILAALLRHQGESACWLDARDVLVVRQGETGPIVDWDASSGKLRGWLEQHNESIVVVTGFVARTPEGVPTTLRRNGSDFSASIFARLLGAVSITIWTDVDGVLSADPRLVPDSFPLERLSYDEAIELAYFGAKVLHPNTMAPAIADSIPILIRNAANPSAPGTRIGPGVEEGPAAAPSRAVRGFSTIDDVALLNIEGTGMIGVPGFAGRLFHALREVGVSVIMISQASSEHSICLALPGDQADRAKSAVERAFFDELHHGLVEQASLTRPCTLLAAVGDAMASTPGVAARLFRSLAQAGINVRAVAQGASERNITVVVDEAESARALRAVHAGFYLSDQSITVGVIGTGGVGGTFLRQLAAQAPLLHEQQGIDLRVCGIARSREMQMSPQGLDVAAWLDGRLDPGEPADLDRFVDGLAEGAAPHRVLIDCTASAEVAARYPSWIEAGFHVITPNKQASSARQRDYAQLRAVARRTRRHYLYEGTVGAGLPVITTLRDLITTGDRVRRIEGVLSGTLSYLFNTFGGDPPFSRLLSSARDAGYTEPDPRDDLSGMDVARKLIILAREMGLALELDDLEVENLVPEELRNAADPQSFLDGLVEYDSAMFERYEAARAAGEALRYVGVIEVGEAASTASVALRRYPAEHPFAGLSGTDNIVAFTTDRYDSQPLIVRGPGAGREVTAGGVFGDLLRLASYLGAPS